MPLITPGPEAPLCDRDVTPEEAQALFSISRCGLVKEDIFCDGAKDDMSCIACLLVS
jgi:hypothetical protein